jgi:DNA-binding NtrC family response regulator
VRNGYNVHRVETAQEGLVQLDAFRPAVVLQDFNLPGMGGLEMLAEVGRRDRRIKVILMTGQGREQVAVDAMKAGAHDYLTKSLVLAKAESGAGEDIEPAAARGRARPPAEPGAVSRNGVGSSGCVS